MTRIFCLAAAGLLSTALLVPPALAQKKPGGPLDRCIAMRERFAKHPASSPQVETRREQRLKDCAVGKDDGSVLADEAAPSDQAQSGQSSPGGQPGESGQGGQSEAGMAPPAAIAAPVSAAAPASTSVNAAAAAAPSSLSRMAMPAAVAKVSPLFTTLDVSIVTGDDDLRANSGAWIDIDSGDGFAKKCYLKQSPPAWDEHSTRDVHCTFSPGMSLAQLKSAKLLLEYDGTPNANADLAPVGGSVDPFQTFDNWKVNEVHVSAIAEGQTPECLISAHGDPQLVEFKSDSATFDLTGRSC